MPGGQSGPEARTVCIAYHSPLGLGLCPASSLSIHLPGDGASPTRGTSWCTWQCSVTSEQVPGARACPSEAPRAPGPAQPRLCPSLPYLVPESP